MISILTVTHARPQWMPWLAEQVRKQTYKDWEWIVVTTVGVVTTGGALLLDTMEAVADGNRCTLVQADRASIPYQRNLALRAARGDIVCWFDDDDWQNPERLEIMYQALLAEPSTRCVSYVANRTSYMLDIQDPARCRPLGYEPFVFNGAGFVNEGLPEFNEELEVDEDINWLKRLPRHDYQIVQRPILSAWISHTTNVTGRRDGQVFDEMTRSRVPLSERELELLREIRRG